MKEGVLLQFDITRPELLTRLEELRVKHGYSEFQDLLELLVVKADAADIDAEERPAAEPVDDAERKAREDAGASGFEPLAGE